MNKLFKVIWSKSKQCYIVVSEVAKNTTGKKKIAVASVLAALAVSAQVATVQAAIPEGTLTDGAIVAIGGNVKANGDSSVVIGKNNEVKTRFSVGIGNNILTESDNAVAIGSGSNNGQVKATGADSIAMGTRAEATKQSSIAIGRLSKSITDERGVAIGNEAVTNGYAAIAIGNKVNADSKNAISMGNGARAKAEGAVVMGASASAEVKNSVALGEGSTTVSADGADTTGYLTNDAVNNSEHGVLSIGNGSTITRRILSVASGTNDTDAVNVKQLKALRNTTLSTLSVVDGSTTTDVVPTTSVPASVTDVNERAKLEKELHKVKLVAGKNITLTANGNAVTIASKSEVNSITSTNADAISITTGTDGTVSVTPNLASDVNADADANKLVTAGKVKAALAQKANASDVNDLKAKLGNISADGRDGQAAGTAGTTAAEKGLTGQDGLNGKSLTDKVNALRNGEAGSVVYTDDEGNRLVKANDGKYYKATQVGTDGNKIGDATPIGEDKLQASVMNPDGTKNPTKLSNLKDGKIAENSKDAVTGNQLYAAKAEVAKYLGGNAAVAEDGTITEPTYTIKDKDGKDVQKHNVGDALSTMNDRLNAANSAVTADITNLKNMEGLTAAGINKIKELAGQGVNVTGDKNITVEPTVEKGVKTFHATLSDDLKLGGPDKEHPNVRVNGTDSTVTAGTGDKEVKMNGADGTITAGDGANGKQVKLDGKDGSVQANKVTAGKDDKAVSLDGDTGTITAGTGENAVAINGTNATIKAGTGENQVGINGRDGSVTAKTVKAKGGNFGAPVDAKGIPTEVGTATSMDKDGFSVTSKDENGNVSKVTIKDGRVSAGNPVDAKGIPTEAGSATSMDKDGFSVATKDEKGNVSKVDIKNGGITAGAPVDAKGIPTEVGTTTSMDKDNGFSVTTKDKDGNVSKVTIKDGKISGLNGSEYDNYKKDDKGNIVKDKDGNPVVDSKVSVNGSGMTITPTEKDKQPVSLTKDGLNNGGNKITNVKDGVIAQGSNDVVNGNQIFNANTSIANAIGGGATVKEDGTISAPTFNITNDNPEKGQKEVNSVGAAIGALDARINNARNLGDLTPAGKKVITDLINVKGEGNIEVPDATTDDKGVKTFTVKLKDTVTLGKGANQVQMDGTQGVVSAGEGKNKVEMNGAKGTITLGDKDGDTNVKLNASEGSVTANIGTFGAPVDGNGIPTAAGSATSMDKDGFSVTSKDETGNVSKVTIKDGRVSAGNPVDGNGIPAEAGSATSMDKDGFSVATKDEKGNVSKVDIKNGGITAGAPVDEKGVPTKEGVNTTTITDKGLSVVSKNADGTVSKVEIKDGKITGLNGSDYNNYKKDKDGNVVKDKDGNPVVDSSVKMDGAGLSIAPSTGDPKKSVSLTKDGLNNGGNRITNVADGIEDSDAVTVGQVKEVTSKLGAALEKTSQRVREVGAHSAALAAMNPLSYDPLRKSQIMAGIGSYDGNQALALGIAHYANENFMFNAGITMGSGKSMANIGATYRFGAGDDDNIPERYKGGPISSVYVMQDEISALKAENARKDAENAEMKAQIKMLMERMGMA